MFKVILSAIVALGFSTVAFAEGDAKPAGEPAAMTGEPPAGAPAADPAAKAPKGKHAKGAKHGKAAHGKKDAEHAE